MFVFAVLPEPNSAVKTRGSNLRGTDESGSFERHWTILGIRL